MSPAEPDVGTDSAGRTFAFIDLAGFTAMTEAMSDEDAADVVARFCEIAREALGSNDQLVKSIGDAVMLVSPIPAEALQLVGRALDLVGAETNFPLPRAGLHHGPAAERDGDFFGAAVNLAARVAGQAQGGQVLATTSVADAARVQNLRVVSLGSFRLRNVTDELDLYEIHVGPPIEGGAIDPVCRMRVERDSAAGRLRYGEADFWFCSLKCAALFASAPASYAHRALDCLARLDLFLDHRVGPRAGGRLGLLIALVGTLADRDLIGAAGYGTYVDLALLPSHLIPPCKSD